MIIEYYRRKIIKRISTYCVNEGDYELLKKWYRLSEGSTRLTAIYSYNLPYNTIPKVNKTPHLMIGHSATKTCRHIETFDLLKDYKEMIEVYCPLSYPKDPKYVNTVTTKGKSIFGERFHAIEEYMNYEQYIEFLNSIDIGIFNNSRQQGHGNILSLLYLGKKVYLSSDNMIRTRYPKSEFAIFDISQIKDQDFLIPLSEEQILKNRCKISNILSDNYFYESWNRIFQED